jgi:hypothetical protein
MARSYYLDKGTTTPIGGAQNIKIWEYRTARMVKVRTVRSDGEQIRTTKFSPTSSARTLDLEHHTQPEELMPAHEQSMAQHRWRRRTMAPELRGEEERMQLEGGGGEGMQSAEAEGEDEKGGGGEGADLQKVLPP